MSQPSSGKRPWPMKWIVIAILACIIPYTWLTVQFRKPNPAYQPYHDNKERAQVKRLLDAGVRRVYLAIEPAADAAAVPPEERASVHSLPDGLAEDVRAALIDAPFLPVTITDVTAPARARAGQSYPLTFTATQRDARQRIVIAAAYLQGRHLTLVAEFQEDQGSGSRTVEQRWQLALPAGLLQAGSYDVVLAGGRESRGWRIDVRE